MTIDNRKSTDEKQSSASGIKEKKVNTGFRHELILYAVSIFLFIFLVSAVIYFLNEAKKIREANQSVFAKTESQQERVDQRITGLEEAMKQLQDNVNTLSNTLSEMHENRPDSNEDWALAEVEYLLIIATHRLVLEQDVATALKAMEAASLRLESLADSGLIPVRAQITSDMNRLRAVNTVNVTGLSIYLADLVEKVHDLPVKKPELHTPDTGTGESRQARPEKNGRNLSNIFSEIWNELKSLVVIRKTGDVKNVLLLPDQEYFLYQNLRLELENARISVLMRNTENLRTSVRLIINWLQTYFDTSDSGVANILDSLNKMVILKLDPELPDISSSLESLRAYMHQRDTAQVLINNIMIPVSK